MEDKHLSPLYMQAAERIIYEIKNNNFREGEIIPRMNHLSRLFKMNVSSMEKALKYLIDQNILSQKDSLNYMVNQGAKQTLLEKEKMDFLTLRLPAFMKEAKELGIHKEQLLQYMGFDRDYEDKKE